MTRRHRLNRIPAWVWATVTVVAVFFSFLWSNHVAEQTLAHTETRLEKAQEAKEPLADRVAVLEEYVALCKETPKACQQVPDPDEIEPRVIRGPGPTLEQLRAVVLPLLPEMVDDRIRRDCGKSCEGEDGSDGEDGEPGEPGADGQPGADSTVAGPAGKDAPVVTDITCTGMTAPTTFVFTFSDGTSYRVECRMLPPVRTAESGS